MGDGDRLALMAASLQRTFDAAGALLREKPDRFVRYMARLARKRARLGLEAIERGDLFAAASLFGWAKDAIGVADAHYKHVQLWPDAQSRREQKKKGREAHERAYGTPADRARRDERLAREFDRCRQEGAGKEIAYRAVARKNGVSDRIVRDAVKNRI